MALGPIFSSLSTREFFNPGVEETISIDEEDTNPTSPASDEIASPYFDEEAYELARSGKKRSFSEFSDEVVEITRKKIKNVYRAQEGFVNFDSARQSQIEAQRSERGSHSKTMSDEKDRFGKVAASQNSQNLTERGIGTLLSNPPSDIYNGVILFKKETLAQFSSEELKSFQSIIELEKFEKLFRIDPYKNSDYYYTSEIGKLPNDPQKLLAGNIFILTGKFEEHPIPDNASESLRENLYVAQETIKYVHKWIPFSSNYLQRSQLFNQGNYDPACIRKITEVLKKSFEELSTKAPYTCPLNLVVKESLKHKVGNGAYLALCGYYYLKKIGVAVDLVSIEPGDYGFLLFGRNKAIPVSDYKNWGADAVICDTLTGAYYPASELSKYLMDGRNIITHEEMQYTLVKQFDPSTQTLYHVPDPKETY